MKAHPSPLAVLGLLTLVASVASPSDASAQSRKRAASGGHETGGGDVELIREPEIRAYIQDPGGLKADLKAVFARIKQAAVRDADLRSKLGEMIRGDVQSDIDRSRYLPGPTCRDSAGGEHSASTLTGVADADVCFSLPRLARLNVKRSQLVGLAAHEHARHFGFDDTERFDEGALNEGHPIGAYVAGLAVSGLSGVGTFFDAQPLSSIGAGSVLAVAEDIIIMAGEQDLYFRNGSRVYSRPTYPERYCTIHLVSKSSQSRVLQGVVGADGTPNPKPDTFEISTILGSVIGTTMYVAGDLYFACYTDGGARGPEMLLSEARRQFGKYLDILPATPLPLRSAVAPTPARREPSVRPGYGPYGPLRDPIVVVAPRKP